MKNLIIPYQEIIGNYSSTAFYLLVWVIIPYQEIIGNYSPLWLPCGRLHYTIPRNNRELQQLVNPMQNAVHYTIPRNNRELQLVQFNFSFCPIIPYQEIIGNYSPYDFPYMKNCIIPYQEIIGNYSNSGSMQAPDAIIPYQEIIGNYSQRTQI